MKQQIIKTVQEWRALLQFFPAGEKSPDIIMELLERMVSTPEQLAWLSGVMINDVGEWKSAKHLRDIFSQKYPPKDGIESNQVAGLLQAGADQQLRQIAEGKVD